MLDPDDRVLLLDALRPPAGFLLECAVGTSFTLDLHALLTAPLALAAFDWQESDGAVPDDPVALMESLRRCADHIDFFCQAGEIKLPPSYHRLYAWLEKSLHEVTPPNSWSIFHPKVWLLKYRSAESENEVAFRFLCASRNLTFDRNWDVLVALDGFPTTETANGAPIGAFVRSLPELAIHPVSAARRRSIVALGDDVTRAEFTAPKPFVGLTFHFLSEGSPSPLRPSADRLLIVSPFVTQDALQHLLEIAPTTSIISRVEELDRMPRELLDRFESRLVLNPAALPLSEERTEGEILRPLVGLHAKLYVEEINREAIWFAGSANSTSAGLGANVEALVELRGTRREVGITTLLAESDDGENAGLRRVLQDHIIPEEQLVETDTERLQRLLDELRRAIAAIPFRVAVSKLSQDRFDLGIATETNMPVLSEGTATISLRPLSLPSGVRLESGAPVDAHFGPLAMESITPFVVVEIVARLEGTVLSDACVLRAELVDEPRDRADRLLASLLASRRDVLRYLLFLLIDTADPSQSGWIAALQQRIGGGDGDSGADGTIELPLLEMLVRTVAREPGKLSNVQRLVAALERTEEGHALLPDRFAETWAVIWNASRTEQRT